MDIFSILTLIGGLALFLFGMNYMGDNLKKLSGSQLESTQILPVIEIRGAVAPHTPVPDIFGLIGMGMILAVPVVRAVPIHDRAAVRLDTLALGVQPYLPRADGIIALFCHTNTLSLLKFLKGV